MTNMLLKYPLDITDSQTIEIPKGGKLLDVVMEEGEPCLIAIGDCDQGKWAASEYESVEIAIYGFQRRTVISNVEYVGSFQYSSRGAVFSVFRVVV